MCLQEVMKMRPTRSGANYGSQLTYDKVVHRSTVKSVDYDLRPVRKL